jgi:TDG/mug DNA glycosylase family protein
MTDGAGAAGEPAILRPGKADLEAAEGRTIPDVIVPDLNVLFCGINPGLYSAAVGHHFARPGNRFWPALYASGFTDRLVSPFEDTILPRFGLGLTNLVARGTASAAELSAAEIGAGARELEKKIRRFRPGRLAVLGVGAYRHAFGKKKAKIGLQEHEIHGTRVWVLPNPSGLNAHYQMADIAALMKELRHDLD